MIIQLSRPKKSCTVALRDAHKTNKSMNDTLSDEEMTAVQDILIGQLNVGREQLTPEARIEEDLGADSLDKVEITMKLEGRFDLTIPDEDAEKIETVGELGEALAALLERASCPERGTRFAAEARAHAKAE